MSGTVTLIGGPYDGYATQQPRPKPPDERDELLFKYPNRPDLPVDPVQRIYIAIYERQDEHRFCFRRFA